jgi:hypothetical protein
MHEHGLREAWTVHAFMPGSPRRPNEWLQPGTVTWLSRSLVAM